MGYSEDIYIVQGMHKEFGHSHVLLFKICLPNHIPTSVHQKKQKKKLPANLEALKSIKQQLWQLFFFSLSQTDLQGRDSCAAKCGSQKQNCFN